MSTLDHEVGDIYLTRNTEEVGNDSPGYWNHAAIYGSSGYVVESQYEPNAVIVVELEKFRERYPHYTRLRYRPTHPSEELIGQQAGMFAFNLVGKPYVRTASWWFWRRSGENCVSVVRAAYKHALRRDPKWWKPDSIAQDLRFNVVELHEDYENWVKPDDWYEGQTYFNP